MSLQNASALLWLIPLLGAILFLYVLRMRRRDLRVPATFLWPENTADIRANAPFQKLRPSLLLFLQLLAMCALLFAIANPLRKTRGLHGRATVMVLDASASMGATDTEPTRFDAAKRRIRQVIETMQSSDRLALISAGATTRVAFPLSGEKAQMLTALESVRRSDAIGDMGEALRLASALVGQQEGGRIIVLSDGSFPPIQDFSPGKAETIFESFGVGSRNVGVVALDSQDLNGNRGTQVFAAVRNFSNDSQAVTLEFVVDGAVQDARRLTIGPRQTVGQSTPITQTAKQVQARITVPGDTLSSDNTASIFLQSAGAIRTLLISDGNLFLERALSLEPTVRLDRAAVIPETEKADTPGESGYDLVIFDNKPVERVKAPSILSFAQVGGDLPAAESDIVKLPRVATWDKTSAPLMNTDLQNLLIQRARRVQLKAGARVLASATDDTPLIVSGEIAGRRSLYVAWHLLESDFPLQVAFPIFISNSVSWLTGGAGTSAGAEGGGLAVRAGQAFNVAAPGVEKTATLTLPGGSTRTLDTSSGAAIVRDADLVGEYSLTTGKRKVAIHANLLSETESDISPRVSLDLPGGSVTSRGESLVLAETWRPLVLLLLLILAIEWWLYVRRS